jgi:hypothetical protein
MLWIVVLILYFHLSFSLGGCRYMVSKVATYLGREAGCRGVAWKENGQRARTGEKERQGN